MFKTVTFFVILCSTTAVAMSDEVEFETPTGAIATNAAAVADVAVQTDDDSPSVLSFDFPARVSFLHDQIVFEKIGAKKPDELGLLYADYKVMFNICEDQGAWRNLDGGFGFNCLHLVFGFDKASRFDRICVDANFTGRAVTGRLSYIRTVFYSFGDIKCLLVDSMSAIVVMYLLVERLPFHCAVADCTSPLRMTNGVHEWGDAIALLYCGHFVHVRHIPGTLSPEGILSPSWPFHCPECDAQIKRPLEDLICVSKRNP